MKKWGVKRELTEKERKNLDKYSDLLAHLLFHRGIKTNEEAGSFINPSYDDVHDPFLLEGMEKAVGRILEAVEKKEKITIFADYDADGIPSAVVLSDFFRKIGYENFEVYIPHRNVEGFGLNLKAVKKIAKGGTKLLITLDCGITDTKEVEEANTLGMDVIITDHHEAPSEVPKAYTIVNPKQSGCQYPEKMLCGAGVAFKLVQALVSRIGGVYEGWEKWLLDMVGIATLSDMVPLVGENRILASYGLIVLQKTKRKGLHILFKDLRVRHNNLTEDDVVFSITPRINAASRMDEPMIAYRMLSSDDDVEAGKAVKHLHGINDERKGHVASMVKQIKSVVSKRYAGTKPRVIVAGNTNWRPSLLGLAATKIMEDYNVPIFLWGRGEGSDLKGSCRSPEHIDVVALLEKIPSSVIETYGGHKNAGGFVVTLQGVDTLDQHIEKYVKGGEVEEEILADYQLRLKDVNSSTIQELGKLAPFGMGNEKPVFVLPNLEISDIRFFGKDGGHIEISFIEKEESRKAVMFYPPEEVAKLKKGMKVNLLANVEYDMFSRSPRLRIISTSDSSTNLTNDLI